MANSYTQIHLHLVFAVRFRNACISPVWKDELQKYISGIIRKNEHKAIVINSMPDHVHALIGLRPAQSLSDLMQDIKGGSSKWINDCKLCPGKFRWQEGFGAFAIYKPDIYKVIDYINNQEEHHKKFSFRDEYRQLLKEHEIEFDEKYIFTELEESMPAAF